LTALAKQLDPTTFVRLNANHLVNVTHLAALVPDAHQRCSLVFRDAKPTTLGESRDVGRRLRAALGW
jgi:DNA-binding LytR/AlgR family response regulator